MSERTLEGYTVTLVGAHPLNKAAGGARIGPLVKIFAKRGARVNLIAHLPYADKFGIRHEKADGLASATIAFPSRWPRLLKGIFLLPFNFVCTFYWALGSDVVYASCGSMLVNMPSIIAAILVRKPFIYDWLDMEIEAIPASVFNFLIRRAAAVFGLSHNLRDQATGLGCKNVVYVPCFVDTEVFRMKPEARKKLRDSWGVKDNDVVIGFAGFQHPQEGVHILLRAAKGLSLKYKNLRLAILGVVVGTRGWTDVPGLTRELGLEDTVIVVPPVTHDEVPDILSAFDILCAPKTDTPVNRATIPIKVIEFLSMGLPTVTTSIGELPRIVRHGVNGYVARPDDVDSLAQTIEEVMADRTRATEIARRGREGVVGEFGIEAIGDTITRTIRAISRK